MPLTSKGETIKKAMQKQYGEEKGKQVFYASESKGTIKGVHPKGSKRAKQVAAMKRLHAKSSK